MMFKKIIKVHGYIGVKAILRHFCKASFQNFKPFLANRALKFQKNANDLKTFPSQNLNTSIKTTQNFTPIWNLEKNTKKLANKKVTGKRSVQNWSLYSSIQLTCVEKVIRQKLILFSNYFHGFEISVKFCVFLILMLKKKKKVLGSWSTYMSIFWK
jgi:hypothetical protein